MTPVKAKYEFRENTNKFRAGVCINENLLYIFGCKGILVFGLLKKSVFGTQ